MRTMNAWLVALLLSCDGQPTATPDSQPVVRESEPWGGLEVVLRGGTDGRGGGNGPVVVLLHGFGARGDGLVALADSLQAPAGTRFVFPAAPIEVQRTARGGRAWWILDPERYIEASRRGSIGELAFETPAGLARARERVLSLLDYLERSLRVEPSRVVLGGFSQGAMLSCDVALSAEHSLAGVALLSGTIVAEPHWRERAPKRRGMRVLIVHGRTDPVLPFRTAERLRDLLVEAGLRVTFKAFDGGHAIPAEARDELGRFLGQLR